MGHEFGHIIQGKLQGWGYYMFKGVTERVLYFLGLTPNPMDVPGTNEWGANFMLFRYNPELSRKIYSTN